ARAACRGAFCRRALDRAETANVERQARELDSDVEARVFETSDDLLEQSLVILEQLELEPPVLRIAKRIEQRAAQAPRCREQLEQGPRPRTESVFLRP